MTYPIDTTKPPTHRLLSKFYDNLKVWMVGELVYYDGPGNWKLEPLDPAARAEWKEHHADPMREFTEHHNQHRRYKGPPSKGTDGLPPPLAA